MFRRWCVELLVQANGPNSSSGREPLTIGGGFAFLIAARKHSVVLVFAAALAGCSSGDPLTNELLTQSITTGGPRKSVCAISSIGDTFSVSA